MNTFAILATGPSMSQEIADMVRNRCRVIAISDAYQLAPDAEAMVSSDAAWWRAHPEAYYFSGKKFTAAPDFQNLPGVERFALHSGSNSGLLACHVAVMLGAKKILLLGYDMGGTHYFGEHPEPLKKTTPQRYEIFKKQFEHFRPRDVEILNCTPNSALRCYPFADLKEQLP